MTGANRDRVKALEAIAWTLVTPEVQAELDSLVGPGFGHRLLESEAVGDHEAVAELSANPGYIERTRRLRALAEQHQAQGGCSLETSRRHIAKAFRRRRGERVAQWGGARPTAGAPVGNRNRRGGKKAEDGEP